MDTEVGATDILKLSHVPESQVASGAVVNHDCEPNCHDAWSAFAPHVAANQSQKPAASSQRLF
jgi:hypothetical protein